VSDDYIRRKVTDKFEVSPLCALGQPTAYSLHEYSAHDVIMSTPDKTEAVCEMSDTIFTLKRFIARQGFHC
jgi:hypothetical protein